MASVNRAYYAYLDGMNEITILLPFSSQHADSGHYTLSGPAGDMPLEIKERSEIDGFIKYVCGFTGSYLFGSEHWVIDSNSVKTDVKIGAVIRSRDFDEKFFYDGDDLGPSLFEGNTAFKLWAPTATMVKLKLYSPKDKYFELVKMARGEKGVWSIDLPRDLEFYRYTYMVCVNQEWNEAVDPYAVAVTVNGEQGVVADLARTKVPRVEMTPFSHHVDAVIYETHIRDLTIHPGSGARHKGLYAGAAENNTVGVDGKPTGISYLKDLGITHIEFLPFNDFAGVDENRPGEEYNWGYNPLHFNVPEGSYSSDPADPYKRITELKSMIETIHSHGMRVIMDVVYNHVYIRESSSFELTVPGYFFRYNEFGQPSDGTGVGNDIASERLMARKYIHDSVRYWVKEYNVDGLRMDLMGILDVETVNGIRMICDSIKPGMIVIGEGWELNTPLPAGEKAAIRNQRKLPGIGQFNDRFRDTIKGSTFNLYERGYTLGNGTFANQAKEAITGSIGFLGAPGVFSEPGQSVNYVEAHDNHTLWDKLEACLDQSGELLKMKCHRLATSLVLLSQGIPFLHSGQEFFRTKQGEGNTYRAPDEINRLDWERKAAFSDNVRYIKGIIEIRKAYSSFRMKSAEQIKSAIRDMDLPQPLIGFHFTNGERNEEVILAVNPTAFIHHVPLPQGEWMVLADDIQAGLVPLKTIPSGESAVLEPVSLMVLLKK